MKNYKLCYKKKGSPNWMARVFNDTLYDNVQRVGNSFPSTFTWMIIPA
ncbi:hypothetical protein ACN08N_26320 (plasmid) [Photobacterium leiognathi subsp. mandapamensis]|nr:hypothetical protein [Vibrio parahaemolyticus]EJG1732868.1 hypothetical protein [Vibrio parahaemolyticus]